LASGQPRDCDLEHVIAQLPDIYRQVILLRYYGGRTCAQIAEELQIATGAVTSRLSRAYRLLKDLLVRQETSESAKCV